MEVFQVIEDVNVRDSLDHKKDKTYTYEDIDRGLYASMEAAVQAIDEFADQELNAAMQKADEAWVSAYPAEEFVNDRTYIVRRKSIMVYVRNDGQYIRSDYYIKKREVKELA